MKSKSEEAKDCLTNTQIRFDQTELYIYVGSCYNNNYHDRLQRDTIPSKPTDADDDDKSSLMTDGTKMIQYHRSTKGDDDETVLTTGQV